MKFYYKDQLVRTSKNHHYTHAVIRETENGFSTFACASSRELAERAKAQEINWYKAQGERLHKHLEAIENGKSEYYSKGRYFRVTPERLEEIKKALAEHNEMIKRLDATLKVVEIEER